MRLLKFGSRDELSLTKNWIEDIPNYAILSHTWGADEDEVTFENLKNGSAESKTGYAKIRFCGEQARKDGLQYFWVDTCCIDKANYAELSEAITSMFYWYRDSVKCYVYLSDVSVRNEGNNPTKQTWESAFRKSRWFTRGWTLQELIAPRSVEFFSCEGKYLGNKITLERQIHEITEIPVEALRGAPLSRFSDHERMRWAENRKTQKNEDKAYCLLGIFGVSIPLIYGEGENAFIRLEEEIDRSSRDPQNLPKAKSNLAKFDGEVKRSLNKLQATDLELSMERIEDSKDLLLKDCYEWILSNPVLQKWRDGNESSLLWIKGDPGKGKTMLMIALSRELVKNLPQNLHPVASFFCQNSDARFNTAAAILRGLIWRLATKDTRLAKAFYTMQQSESNQLSGPKAIYGLFSTLLGMLKSYPGAFILIDAIDECSSGVERELLLDLIAKQAKSSKAKWLISSRNDTSIQQVLIDDGQLLSLELNEEHISKAVRAFIERKTNELSKEYMYSSELEEKVKEGLVSKSDSTFLWIALAHKRLLEVQSHRVLSTLQDLPLGLQDLYARMMDQIFLIKDTQNRHSCLGILRLVTITLRPLSIEELIAGLPPELQACDLSNVIELCSSFITVRKGSIYFVHQSAKNYLVTDGALKLFPAGLQKEHGLVVSRSLDAMSKTLRKDICNLRQPGAPGRSGSVDTRLRAIRYICSFWVAHLEQYFGDNFIDSLSYHEYILDHGRIHKFLLKHLLHWFEALSLIGEVDKGITGLHSLELMLNKTQSENVLHKRFVCDAIRVFRQCRAGVEEAPLQVYYSALIFTSQESLVRQAFKQEMLQLSSLLPTISSNWNPSLQKLEGHRGAVWSVTFSPDGKQLASGSDDHTLRLWDVNTGKCLKKLEGHRGAVWPVAFSPDGKQLASGSDDHTVRLWDTTNGKCLQELKGHRGWVWSVAFSPNGQQLASGSGDGIVWLWDVSTGRCIKTLKGHGGSVRSVVFSHNGQQLASGCCDRTVRQWDASTGKCLLMLEGHRRPVWSVAFSSDGELLASGSGDATVRVWDVRSGKCLHILKGHSGEVRSVAFSPSRQLLASGSGDDTVRLWKASDGSNLQTFDGYTHNVSFSPDGLNLITDSGTLVVKQTSRCNPSQRIGWGIEKKRTWITLDGHRMLWLPLEYRPMQSAVKKNCIGIACASGAVYIFNFRAITVARAYKSDLDYKQGRGSDPTLKCKI